MNIFYHGVTKTQVQFWGTYLMFEASKKSEIFTNIIFLFYQYLSDI